MAIQSQKGISIDYSNDNEYADIYYYYIDR